MDGAPPPPVVPPDAYDHRYFTQVCAGYEEWGASGGTEPGGMYWGFLAMAGLAPGEVLVDLGAGRGDLLVAAVRSGAGRAVGVEYAPAAVELARGTLDAAGVADRAAVQLADVRAAPVRSGSADLVTMLDVVEHLVPAELDEAVREAQRVLRPGGRLFVHTFPTRTPYDVTYKVQRLARPGRRRRWPADPRNQWELLMHVNEQTKRSLRGVLDRAGFDPVRVWHGEWVYTDFVPDPRARRLYRLLAKLPLTRPLGASNLFALARKPGG